MEVRYYDAAWKHLRRLPREHFMEATPQATQRKITLESLDLARAYRSDMQIFNELLVQYPLPRRKKPRQVVPDNMVVVWDKPIRAEHSYDVPLQPARPFWVLDYPSRETRRKDYDDNLKRYEHELRVPYYLLFVPESQEMTLYRHTGEKYVAVVPNEQGRCVLPELELELGLHKGWLRYWFGGELLPLPADLLQELDEARHQRDEAQQQVTSERELRVATEAKLAEALAELERLRRQQ